MRTRATALRWLAALTCAGMFVVLVMGAAVTNTGSAEGCGRSWPLCNGQLVPEFTVSTAIEYSHRAVTGVEGVLVVALTAAMLTMWRRDREPVVLALLMLTTLLLQAGLGAGAVLWPQSPLLLATHFGVSLAAFAATFLSAVVVFERTAVAELVWPSVSQPGPGWTPAWLPWRAWRPWFGSATARQALSQAAAPSLAGPTTAPQVPSPQVERPNPEWRTAPDAGEPGSNWRTAPQVGPPGSDWRTSPGVAEPGNWRTSAAAEAGSDWRTAPDEGEPGSYWRTSQEEPDAGEPGPCRRTSQEEPDAGEPGPCRRTSQEEPDAGEHGPYWRTSREVAEPGSDWRTGPRAASEAVPGSLRRWAVAVGLYVLGVVYLGAYVRHAGVSLACADWPLCNGQLVPALGGPAAVAFAHRVAALGALLLLAWLARLAVRNGVAQLAALSAVGLGVLQALSGALVVWTRLGLFATLAHAAIMALLFACLVYVARKAAVLPSRNDSVRDVFSPSDDTARNLRPTRAVSFPHVLSTTTSGSGAAGLHRPVADHDGHQRAIAERARRDPADEQQRGQGRPEH